MLFLIQALFSRNLQFNRLEENALVPVAVCNVDRYITAHSKVGGLLNNLENFKCICKQVKNKLKTNIFTKKNNYLICWLTSSNTCGTLDVQLPPFRHPSVLFRL